MNALARRITVRLAAMGVSALAALAPAHAGGPLSIVNNAPVVYANGGTSLTLNLDQGTLGSRSNAQASALVQSAIGLWNGVSTSTVRLNIGAPLATDYNATNYSGIFGNFNDGINPVVFDSDGSLTDLLFGTGAKAQILGFAGSSYFTSGPSAGRYREGRAVLNGYIGIPDASWIVVLAHEFGHFFGLDHSQLDASQGLQSNNYVLMYPIAYRTLVSLHEDDVAAVTALYPSATAAATYGQLAGTFTTAGGTPIKGANIWARETSTAKVYSSVSDYLLQGTGYFRLNLPPGTYTLAAEPIDPNFVGGSSVGPYSETATDLSFQAPNPIVPVRFGGATTRTITITAGCVATTTFRVDGSGSVSGNCGPAATTTTLVTSLSPMVVGASVTFTATVTGNAPGGTVGFSDGASAVGGCGAIALTGSGNARTAACTTSALAVGTHAITAAYSGDASNAASTSNTVSEVVNAAPPVLAGAASRKLHGPAGTFDLPLALSASNPTTEPRSGATLTLVATFDRTIASAQASVTEGTATVAGVSTSGNSVIVSLSGVGTGQYVSVAFTSVIATGGSAGGTGTVRVGLLVGDFDGTRSVTLNDVLAVNALLAQPVTAANFTRDVNLSGTISLTDKLAVSTNLSRALPAP